MPREFGQLDAAAWRDDMHWRALPADAQWLYGLLVSQGDLSAAGVLTLAVGRWQRMCSDMTPERLTEALSTLEERRFVFVDLNDLELLIRTFARRKTQWGNPRRRTAVANAARAIHSQRLRVALAVDLSKHPSQDLVADVLAVLPAVNPQEYATFSPEGSPESLAEPLGKVTTEPFANTFETGSRARAYQTPEARRDTPENTPAPASPPRESTGRGRRRDELWEAVMEACEIDTSAITDSARGAYNKALAELRGVKATPEEVARRAANYRARFADAALTPSALAKQWATCDTAPIRAVRGSDEVHRRYLESINGGAT